MIEMRFKSEDAARIERRRLINLGAAVSLLAFDSNRELYVFDVL